MSAGGWRLRRSGRVALSGRGLLCGIVVRTGQFDEFRERIGLLIGGRRCRPQGWCGVPGRAPVNRLIDSSMARRADRRYAGMRSGSVMTGAACASGSAGSGAAPGRRRSHRPAGSRRSRTRRRDRQAAGWWCVPRPGRHTGMPRAWSHWPTSQRWRIYSSDSSSAGSAASSATDSASRPVMMSRSSSESAGASSVHGCGRTDTDPSITESGRKIPQELAPRGHVLPDRTHIEDERQIQSHVGDHPRADIDRRRAVLIVERGR